MRITHISIIHGPLDTRIFEKECRSLAAAGYDVHLVVGGPSDGQLDGVHFHSVAADSARPPLRRQGRRLIRAARCALRLRPSVYHLHDPHLIPLGLLLKLLRARVIYDVHEHYPMKARSKLSPRPLRGRLKALMWRSVEGLARWAFDGFVCASPAIADRFPARRTTVVGNFPDAGKYEPRDYAERRRALIYVGSITKIRGLREMIRALELVRGDLDCRLRLIGSFHSAGLASEAQTLDGWSRVDFSQWQGQPEVVRELLEARIGLVLLHALPNHGDPVRSRKLFEYMAAGIPVIASDLPRWRELIHEVGCGVVVDPRDPEAIARAVEHLLRHPEEAEAMGERGRAAVAARFNWEAEAPRLLWIYKELGAAPSPAPSVVAA